MHRFSIRLVGLVLSIAMLAGCAAKAPLHQPPAARAWDIFQQRRHMAERSFSALSASASINYKSPDRSGRLKMRLWGDSSLPLRMDLSAGFGTTVAMWREDADGWICFFPTDNVAYYNHDVRTGMRMAGLDIPFSLRELTGFISGTFSSMIPDEYEKIEATEDGGWTFFFAPGKFVNTMTLDAQGKAVLFAGRLQGRKWSLNLARYTLEGDIETARKLTLALSPGVSAVVRVKQLAPKTAPWSKDSLSLGLPAGTQVRSLGGNGS